MTAGLFIDRNVLSGRRKDAGFQGREPDQAHDTGGASIRGSVRSGTVTGAALRN